MSILMNNIVRQLLSFTSSSPLANNCLNNSITNLICPNGISTYRLSTGYFRMSAQNKAIYPGRADDNTHNTNTISMPSASYARTHADTHALAQLNNSHALVHTHTHTRTRKHTRVHNRRRFHIGNLYLATYPPYIFILCAIPTL